jgi:hypothetical protein
VANGAKTVTIATSQPSEQHRLLVGTVGVRRGVIEGGTRTASMKLLIGLSSASGRRPEWVVRDEGGAREGERKPPHQVAAGAAVALPIRVPIEAATRQNANPNPIASANADSSRGAPASGRKLSPTPTR